MPAVENYLVISAIGADRPGIVNTLSMTVLDNGCNIVDSRMTVLGGEFAILLMVAGSWDTISRLEQALPKVAESLNLTLISKRTKARSLPEKMLPYLVEVVSMDHPGIVYNVAEFFSSRNINIEDLSTGSYAAAHTGTPMFSMNMTISIPAEQSIAELREQFMQFCDELNLDAVMEPVKA
ncbi:MAG: glycine cleavage system protein R [Granulosicoccaceae bacterium]|jgi:glycine cleavage system transcriptional repressor